MKIKEFVPKGLRAVYSVTRFVQILEKLLDCTLRSLKQFNCCTPCYPLTCIHWCSPIINGLNVELKPLKARVY